jgi:hypothetical protein
MEEQAGLIAAWPGAAGFSPKRAERIGAGAATVVSRGWQAWWVLRAGPRRWVPPYVAVSGEAGTNATVTLWWGTNEWAPVVQQGRYWYGEAQVKNRTGGVWVVVTNLGVVRGNPDRVQSEVRSDFVAQTPETLIYDADGNLVRGRAVGVQLGRGEPAGASDELWGHRPGRLASGGLGVRCAGPAHPTDELRAEQRGLGGDGGPEIRERSGLVRPAPCRAERYEPSRSCAATSGAWT